MCGSYATKGSGAWREFHDQLMPKWPVPTTAQFNIRPTDSVPLIRQAGDGYRLDKATWWLIPASSGGIPNRKYPMFNARAESLVDRLSYRKPFLSQRGLMPMNAFAEHCKDPERAGWWSVTNEIGGLAAAALWDIWRGADGQELLSCTLVTTAAAAEFAPWHNRMPVLLTSGEWPRWLDNRYEIAMDDPVFRPELKFPLLLAPLGPGVGNVRNKSPETMDPAGATLKLAG